jgi:DNA repair protein RecN (Recombination protein N)
LIETLRIENLAIVDRVELDFGPGLNVLTGETGAGKSIVLGALSLLAGARASADGIREGSDDAAVEAVFQTARLADLEGELERRGIETDDHLLVIRRTLSRAGRGRSRVGGELVPVATLADLCAGRLEISSQHDSHSLLRADVHGRLLDTSGGLLAVRSEVASGHAALREIDDALAQLRAAARERIQRLEFLRFQVEEIDAAKLDPEAHEALRTERGRLAHAGRLGEEGAAALAQLSGDPGGDGSSAADLLGDAARRLKALENLDPELAALGDRLDGVLLEARDVALELERVVDGIEADPARLAGADARLHAVEVLQRKYGASVEEVLAFRDRAGSELATLESADARIEALETEREAGIAQLSAAADRLSRGRKKAARKLAREVQASLRELSMPEARFAVSLDAADVPHDVPCGPTGREAPEFRFSANPGEPLRPLRRIASGGELSRAFLGIKRALRESDAGMVLVFDEVDAGIGGRAADRVGRTLAELAQNHQVLCITHLPQVAAFADTHFRVTKSTRDGRAAVEIAEVRGAERIEEIARMAGGDKVGEATRRHARDLLGPRATA